MNFASTIAERPDVADAAASFPVERIRARFPALRATTTGAPRRYFDAPGGTQACDAAIDAMAAHLRGGTANVGGAFETSRATMALSAAAHAAMADLLGGRAEEIAFGPNMTTLTLAVSRALAPGWGEGDELVLTRLDHDANVAPWLRVAADRGMTVRWLDFDAASGALRMADLAGLLGPRTRLVAIGAASNLLGTVNDLAAAVAIIRRRSPALVCVDAVQAAPHLPIDVAALGCDLLLCSPYKSFGPHQGVLWGRADLLDRLAAYKVRPAPDAPGAVRFETGTPSFEGQAGVIGMVDYLDWLGGELAPRAATRRERLTAAMTGSTAYEEALGDRLLEGLAGVAGLRLYGPAGMRGRVPTFAFRVDGREPAAIARRLAERSIFVGAGHFYAVEAVERLGFARAGGVVRAGLCHYNTDEEVDALVGALAELCRAP